MASFLFFIVGLLITVFLMKALRAQPEVLRGPKIGLIGLFGGLSGLGFIGMFNGHPAVFFFTIIAVIIWFVLSAKGMVGPRQINHAVWNFIRTSFTVRDQQPVAAVSQEAMDLGWEAPLQEPLPLPEPQHSFDHLPNLDRVPEPPKMEDGKVRGMKPFGQ